MKEIRLGVDGMPLDALVVIAREGPRVRLTMEAERKIVEARKLVEKWVEEGKTIYGITTGFGGLSDVSISKEDARRLQENIIMGHSAGVGPLLDEETVRAVIALRIKDLARGHSGIRLETVLCLQELLNRGVHSVFPGKGSVGASGDLASLAHLSLVPLGLGEAFSQGQRIDWRAGPEEVWDSASAIGGG